MKELFPGYTIERLPEIPGKLGFAYRVIGPRGKTWKLCRNQVTSHLLFPIGENLSSSLIRFAGTAGLVMKPCQVVQR